MVFAEFGGREKAPLDLGARGGGLALGERAGGALALELGQLVAIDRQLAVEPVVRATLARSSGISSAPTVAVVSSARRNSSTSVSQQRSMTRRRSRSSSLRGAGAAIGT